MGCAPIEALCNGSFSRQIYLLNFKVLILSHDILQESDYPFNISGLKKWAVKITSKTTFIYSMETFYCSLYSYYPCAINMIFLYTRENVGTTYLLFEFF